jgi:hypothetical protein
MLYVDGGLPVDSGGISRINYFKCLQHKVGHDFLQRRLIVKWITTIILVLAGLVIYGLYQKNQTPDLAAEYRYALQDVDEIAKIRINYRLIDPDILLEKKQEYWLLNGKYRVREDAMENLLNAIRKIELQYIPTTAARKNMMVDLATTGTKVEILNKKGEVLKAFFVGGTTPDERGTYMIMDGSQSPAVVTLSGFEGSIRPYFIMPEIEWRDRIVYREDPDLIEELTVDYPGQPQSSFSVRKQGEGYRVFPLDDRIKTKDLVPRQGAVEAYFRNYRSLGAEAIMDDSALITHLQAGQPFARILIRRSDQTSCETRFYPVDIQVSATSKQIERYHVLDDQGNLFLVQHLLFGKLFLGFDYFFEDNTAN